MSITSAMVEAGILGLAKNPFTIAGTMGAGNVLTVTPLAGYTATGSTTYQWTRNGADIAGQTASTYTQLSTDRNATIGCRVAGLVYSVSAGTVPITAPGAPTIGTVTPSNGAVSGAFTAPSDNGGSAITGYQMAVYRASDNALLGTAAGPSSPLTLNGLTNGVTVYAKVAAVNALGVGTQSAASASVTPNDRTGILRAVSSFNRHPSKLVQASTSFDAGTAGTYEHVIGSGDVDGIVGRITNRVLNTAGVTNNANTINNLVLYAEHIGAGRAVQAKINGSTAPYTVAAGLLEQLTDVLLPSDFGLSKFSRGDVIRWKYQAVVPQSGYIPSINYYDRSSTGTRGTIGYIYNPANTTINNVSGVGSLTATGTAPTLSAVISIAMLGYFTSSDPLVIMEAKDSLGEGSNDTAGSAAGLGTGQFHRALYNGGTAPLAGFNVSLSGTGNAMWTGGSATLQTLLKYVNVVDYGLGTNAFDNTANNATALSNNLSVDNSIWLAMRANASTAPGARPLKIYGEKLGPRSAAGGDYATLAGQTVYGPKWDIGGDVASRNAAYDSYVGNQLDGIFDPGPVLRGSSDPASLDFYKWLPSYSSDGTHYSPTGVVPWATAKRAFYMSL